MNDINPIPEWTVDAACIEIGPEAFFPKTGDNGHAAKQICGTCTAREACLEYALTYESGALGTDLGYGPVGIYGGLSAHERKAILRDRRATQEEDAA